MFKWLRRLIQRHPEERKTSEYNALYGPTLRCESRGASGHRCVRVAGHIGRHQASELAARHW